MATRSGKTAAGRGAGHSGFPRCECGRLSIIVAATGEGDPAAAQIGIRRCDFCHPRVSREDVAEFVQNVLSAIAEIRDLLWPPGNSEASCSPDTIEAIGRALAFLAPREPSERGRRG
jgi:hypothetical protein